MIILSACQWICDNILPGTELSNIGLVVYIGKISNIVIGVLMFAVNIDGMTLVELRMDKKRMVIMFIIVGSLFLFGCVIIGRGIFSGNVFRNDGPWLILKGNPESSITICWTGWFSASGNQFNQKGPEPPYKIESKDGIT